MEVLDLTGTFRSYTASQLKIRKIDTEHPNAFGHSLIADRLYRHLKKGE